VKQAFLAYLKHARIPSLKPTSTKLKRIKILAQGNNGSVWWGSNSGLAYYESKALPIMLLLLNLYKLTSILRTLSFS